MTSSQIESVLRAHLHDPGSGFAVGSQGAIAEFHRALDEPLAIGDPSRLRVATERGAISIEPREDIEAVAYEALGRRRGRWQQGVVDRGGR